MKPATFRPIAPYFAAMMMGSSATAASEEPQPVKQRLAQEDMALCLVEGVTAFSQQTIVKIGVDERGDFSAIGMISPNNGVKLSVTFGAEPKLDRITAISFSADGSKSTMGAYFYDPSDMGDLLEVSTGPSQYDMDSRAFSAIDVAAGCAIETLEGKTGALVVTGP